MLIKSAAALRRPTPPTLNEKVVWSLADASKATTLSVRTLQKLIAGGKLPASRVGRRVLLDPHVVKAVLLGPAQHNSAATTI